MTLATTPQTAQRLQLTPERREYTAKVCNWDSFQTTEYTAADIAAVSIRGDIVWVEFTNGGATAIDKTTFKAKVQEFKSESQLSEEQEEIIEAAIDAPFEAEINFQDAIASFYSDEDGFMGTVRKDRYIWKATTETAVTVHKSAFDAVQSLTTCTYEEWEEAKAGLEGIRYHGNGYWQHPQGGRINTAGLLSYLHIEKTDRQIAILEQRILIADDC